MSVPATTSDEPGLRPCVSREIPQVLLETIMAHIATEPDLATLVRVNSAFYAAARPQLFREIELDREFNIIWRRLDDPDEIRAKQPLADTYAASGRPIFLRRWLTRFCTTMDVAEHDPSTCAAGLLPPLNLETIVLPYDIHGSLATATPLSACGLHALRVRGVVHRFHTCDGPTTTSNFAAESVSTYTVYLKWTEFPTRVDRNILWFLKYEADVSIVLPPRGTEGQKITHCLAPRRCPKLPLETPSRDCLRRMGCRSGPGNVCSHKRYRALATFALVFVWKRRANVVIVGLDEYCEYPVGTKGHSHSYLAWIVRRVLLSPPVDDNRWFPWKRDAAFAELSKKFGSFKDPEIFTLLGRVEWLMTAAGQSGVAYGMRKSWARALRVMDSNFY